MNVERMEINRTFSNVFLLVLLLFAGALTRFEAVAPIAEIAKWPIFLVFLLYSAYIGKPQFGKKAVAFLLFLIVVSFSSIYRDGINSVVLAGLAPFFAIFAVQVGASRAISKNIGALLFGLYLFCVLNMIVNLPTLFFSEYYIGIRFAGIYKNTNILSGFATLSFVIFMVKFDRERKKGDLIFLAFSICIIFFTRGRTALLASLIILFLYVSANYPIFTKKGFLVGSVFLLLGFSVVGSLSFSDKTEEIDRNSATIRKIELGARAQIMERQLEAFYSSPLIGVGVVSDENDSSSRFAAESSFVDLLSIGGVLGALPLLFYFFHALNSEWKRRREPMLYIMAACMMLALAEGYLSAMGSAVSIVYWTLSSVENRA